MKLKRTIVAVYALALIGSATVAASLATQGIDIVMLNNKGARTYGPVRFDHRQHAKRINPDPEWPYQAKAGAACSGCHHSINNVGIPQLWKCTVCHQDEGKGDGKYPSRKYPNCDQGGNPKNKDCDEVFFERAFHDSCIGCHRAEIDRGKDPAKTPVTCTGCHMPKAQ
jgi:hypothetical protein